ncbi:MAG TPA: hypothetical protein VGQ65_20610 [Thermoanaerobaculia bacterium]|jgi:hypothetical protein|nr:hypothetical protein [Thermoanaerobaculia bacterium]
MAASAGHDPSRELQERLERRLVGAYVNSLSAALRVGGVATSADEIESGVTSDALTYKKVTINGVVMPLPAGRRALQVTTLTLQTTADIVAASGGNRGHTDVAPLWQQAGSSLIGVVVNAADTDAASILKAGKVTKSPQGNEAKTGPTSK